MSEMSLLWNDLRLAQVKKNVEIRMMKYFSNYFILDGRRGIRERGRKSKRKRAEKGAKKLKS